MNRSHAKRGWLILLVMAGLAPLKAVEPAAEEPPAAQKYPLWVADSLVKVMETDPIPESPVRVVRLDVARGEREDAQIVVRPTQNAIAFLTARATALVTANPSSNDSATGATLPAPRIRFVGYVPVRLTSPIPKQYLVAQGTPACPAWIPDPLYDMPNVDVWKDTCRPIWLTFDIPHDAVPGVYTGKVSITANEATLEVPVELTVHDATVPLKRHLHVTNWIKIDCIDRWAGCEPFDDRYWEAVEAYARNMVEHRQNVILAPLSRFWTAYHLLAFEADGNDVRFNFTHFDRWCQTFLDAGIEVIEGGHIGHGGKVDVYLPVDGTITRRILPADHPDAVRYLTALFKALSAHLEAKGWKDRYIQHIMDEPNDTFAEAYNKATDLAREHLPGVRTIDAMLSTKIRPPDIMVPILYLPDAFIPGNGNLAERFDKYKKLQSQGHTLWYYICGAVSGPYVCRELDHHLLRTRYIHWLNFKYGITGFLHWGYNWWETISPFIQNRVTHSSNGSFPPGDGYVVYPAPRFVMDSIRWEAQRDSIEDYELLRALSLRDEAKAHQLADRLVHDFGDYEMDVARFRAVRRELLSALSP